MIESLFFLLAETNTIDIGEYAIEKIKQRGGLK